MCKQLSIFDIVFDQNVEVAETLDYEVKPIATTVERSLNLCPYAVPTADEIIKLIDKYSYSVDHTRYISNIFECGALAISNSVDLSQFDDREKRYKQIIAEYNETAQKGICEIFSKIFLMCSSVVYDNGIFGDYLGDLFMRLNQGNKHAGQFFTPYNVSKMMAEIIITEEKIRQSTENDGVMTIADPCCGGGGMIMAALSTLKERGVNYARNCFVECTDIDIRCVHMTYLQLALAGVPAIVKHQDALSRQLWSVWRTPAFMFQYPRFARYASLN